MKNLLLLTTTLLCFNVFSQLNCSSAISISTNGQLTCPQITGTVSNACVTNQMGANATYSIWYSYTATSNGEVTISSNFPANDGVTNSNNTRLSILSGNCSALQCYDFNDNISGSNLLSELVFPVQSGTTYYIVWDSKWSNKPFLFNFSFSVPSCIKANAALMQNPTNLTTTSAQLNWNAAIGSPSSYDIEYGPSGFVQGNGTTVNTTQTNLSISNLTPTSGVNDVYLRSNCGAQQTAWAGPIKTYLPKTVPYSQSFENAADYFDGFTHSGWVLNNLAGGAQNGSVYSYSFSSTTGTTDAPMFSRAIYLQANVSVNLSFYTRLSATSGGNHTLKMKVNNVPSTVGATQLGSDFSISGTTYSQRTVNFTPTTTGVYYFIFHNVTPMTGTSTSLRVDNINITTVLSSPSFSENAFVISPNPASETITINNTYDYNLETIEIYDLNGRLINKIQNNQPNANINIADLSNGVYLLKLVSSEGIAIKKFIKE